MVTILVLYFNDYDIHVNTLFKAVKDAFTVKVKNVYIQVPDTVDVKRIVTRLALFHLSEGQSRSSNGSHKAINYSGTPSMRSPLGYKILILILVALTGEFRKNKN